MAKNNQKKVTAAQAKLSPAAGKPQSAPKKTENQKQTATMTKKAAMAIALIVTVFVIALSAYFLIARNSDVLFMAQSKSFFTTNILFLHECMRQPGGLLAWASCFLTQFFYHPALGGTIMIGIWVASLWMSKVAFKVQTAWMAVLSIPVICLLVSMIDTGYWIYYLKQEGYWFYGTLGYLMVMVAVLIFSLFKRRTDKFITTIITVCCYPYFGWYALLAALYMAVMTLATKPEEGGWKDRFLQPAIAVILVAAVPWICYYFYSETRLEDAWTMGFPYFTNDKTISYTREIPFMLLAIVPLLFPFLPKEKAMNGKMIWVVYVATIGILVGAYMWTDQRDFKNYNYHAEMRMYRAAEEQHWEEVLDEMSSLPGDASRQMVLMKNIALLNTGEMGTKMFRYNNMGATPVNDFDTLHIHMVQTAAPLIYYYHGKTNFASRWCIENSVEFGSDFDNLKILARCALVGGEMDVAKKYLDILSTSIYYKDWAENLLPITENPSLIKEHHEFDNVRELRDNMGSVLDGDNGLCEMYLLNYFSNTMNKDSKLLQELTLNYALIQKDIQLFWPRFFLYAQMHQDQDMPTHYQEAAYLYGNLEPQTVNIVGMPFDQQKVIERYQNFQQLSQSLLASGMKAAEVGEAMKSSYGDTFYWFYFFCRDIHSY